ncbi:MAG: bifunctional diaminohydroxyphosphoribosylaminopyrimidine deaminase/5-amino-6-(5-phosphoribosylamino)uracil reductase RibD [Ahrensia sp.]
MTSHSARDDARFMAAAVRLSRHHLGLTGTNPSVATLIVKDGFIVGRGITARGGRPHAEAQALAEAGDNARGATAYVTLEPCAHHGRTPPCAEALVRSGVSRVVGAIEDPDDRVAGRGYEILRQAGIEVVRNVGAADAMSVLGHYWGRAETKRAQVTLKLAVSADGKIGFADRPQAAVTGPIAKAQSHIMRAQHDAILIGSATARIDNPSLTCRLAGLASRSPVRIVLDTFAMLDPASALVQSALKTPLWLVTTQPECERAQKLRQHGVRIIAAAGHDGRIALPELMDDLAALGITSILVEGGAAVAQSFLRERLVRRIALFESPKVLGADAVTSPIRPDELQSGFAHVRSDVLGDDKLHLLEAS